MPIVRQGSLFPYGYKLKIVNCRIINNHDIGWELRNVKVIINNLTWVNWTGTAAPNSVASTPNPFMKAHSSTLASLKISNSVFRYINWCFH